MTIDFNRVTFDPIICHCLFGRRGLKNSHKFIEIRWFSIDGNGFTLPDSNTNWGSHRLTFEQRTMRSEPLLPPCYIFNSSGYYNFRHGVSFTQ